MQGHNALPCLEAVYEEEAFPGAPGAVIGY